MKTRIPNNTQAAAFKAGIAEALRLAKADGDEMTERQLIKGRKHAASYWRSLVLMHCHDSGITQGKLAHWIDRDPSSVSLSISAIREKIEREGKTWHHDGFPEISAAIYAQGGDEKSIQDQLGITADEAEVLMDWCRDKHEMEMGGEP